MVEARSGMDRRRLKILSVVLVIAVVVLASLSVSLWRLERHYYDAKYRAQYVLVATLQNSTFVLHFAPEDVLNSTLPDAHKMASADRAGYIVAQGFGAAHAVEVMYPNTSHEAGTLALVGYVLRLVGQAMAQYSTNLSQAIQLNSTLILDPTVRGDLNQIDQGLLNLTVLLRAGFDELRSFYDHPYSLVKRMDLDAIGEVCAQIGVAASHMQAQLLRG